MKRVNSSGVPVSDDASRGKYTQTNIGARRAGNTSQSDILYEEFYAGKVRKRQPAEAGMNRVEEPGAHEFMEAQERSNRIDDSHLSFSSVEIKGQYVDAFYGGIVADELYNKRLG